MTIKIRKTKEKLFLLIKQLVGLIVQIHGKSGLGKELDGLMVK
jgi:hypothetical protein